MDKYKFRKPELDQFRTLWLTKQCYEILREQKKIQKLSLAKIVCNLILKEYENTKGEVA